MFLLNLLCSCTCSFYAEWHFPDKVSEELKAKNAEEEHLLKTVRQTALT